MQRKKFIKTLGCACIGATSLATLLQSCSSTNYFAQSTLANNQLTIKKSEFIKIVNGKHVQRIYILVRSEKQVTPICIYKISDDNYSALLMVCTHNGCELNPQGNYLVCPCHGSEFSNTGVVQNPPAEQNLKSFKTTTDNDNIYIQL